MTSSKLRGRTSNVVRLFLPVVLLVPATVLFSMVWQGVGDQVSVASAERRGIRYIQTLGPLEIALTNAQSTAVNGGTANREPVNRAVDAVSRIDDELSGEMRTHDRWTELRAKIEALPASGSSTSIHTSYTEATNLLIALIDKVRNDSKLIRDPEADTYYLEDAAAQELPGGVISASRYTDLIIIAAGKPEAEQAKSVGDIAAARSELVSNAQDVSDDIRLAVEGTGSRSLGGTLLAKLDRYNRAIDALIPAASQQQDRVTSAQVSQVIQARDAMQSAAADLSETLLSQIDDDLKSRLSGLDVRRMVAVLTLAVAIVLALSPSVLALLGRRGRRDRGATRRRGQTGTPPEPPRPAAVEPNQWRSDPAVPQPVPSDPQYAAWERFDVSR